MSQSKLVLLFAVAAVAGLVAMASLAIANERANSIVTIHGDNGDFHGRIHSKRQGCLGDRIVKVYKQKGDSQRPKRDPVIAKDISEKDGDHGVWAVGNTGFKKGNFYAKVRRNDACRANFSQTIHL